MPNFLDTVQLSGSSYDIKDKNAANVSGVTQSEYDDLPSSAKSSNTLFVITDAQSVDISNYWTSAQTNSAITAAVSGKVDTSSVVSSVTSASTDNEIPTAKAVYDAIPTGGTGGGKAIEAGRGITVTTGETADTVSFSLPLSAGTSASSIIGGNTNCSVAQSFSFAYGDTVNINSSSYKASVGFGQSNTIQASNSFVCGLSNSASTLTLGAFLSGEQNKIAYKSRCAHVEGGYNIAKGDYAHSEGFYNITNNQAEHASGQYNVSNTGSTNADKTLFSVGNGSSDNARHNAFEIRQNGDIYLTLNGNDVKLQDYLGNTVEVSSAITSGDTNAVAGGAVYDKLDEIEQVTARALNELAEANEVIARALNDLNDRITAIEARLNNS